MNQTYSIRMLHTQKFIINHTNNEAKKFSDTFNLDWGHHRFGLSHNTPQNTTSLQVNTHSAGVFQSSKFSSNQYSVHHRPNSIQSPAINAFKRRRNRQRATTSLPIVITTPMRGDQPPNDDDSSNEEFVPLGVKNQPVTVQPIYFTNEHDTTQRRITNNKNKTCRKNVSFSTSFTLFFFFFFLLPDHFFLLFSNISIPALKPGNKCCIHFILCVHTFDESFYLPFIELICSSLLCCISSQNHFVNRNILVSVVNYF